MLNFNISTHKLIDIATALFNVGIDQRKKKYTKSYILIYQKDMQVHFITNYQNISYKKTFYCESAFSGWCIIDLTTFYKNLYQFSLYQKKNFYNTNNLIFNITDDELKEELIIKFNNTTLKFKSYNSNDLFNEFIEHYTALNNITYNLEDETSFSLDKLNFFNVDTYKLIKNKTNLYNNISPAFFSLDFQDNTLSYIDNRYPDAICFIKLRMNIIKQFIYNTFEANIPIPVFKWLSFYKRKDNKFIFIVKNNDIYIIRDLVNDNTEYHSTKKYKTKAEQMVLFNEISSNIRAYRKEPASFNNKLNLFEVLRIKNCKINLHENIFNDVLNYNKKFASIEFNLNHLKQSLALLQAGNLKAQEDSICTLHILNNNLTITIADKQNFNKIEQSLTIVNKLNNAITVTLNTRVFIRIIKALNIKFLDNLSTPFLDYYLNIVGNDNNHDVRLVIENKNIIDNHEVNNCFAQIKCCLSKDYNYYSQLKGSKKNEH